MDEAKERVQPVNEGIGVPGGGNSENIGLNGISMKKPPALGQKSLKKILDSASALKELGLIDDAIGEYEKLLELGGPVAKLIPLMVSCGSAKYQPPKLMNHRIHSEIVANNVRSTATSGVSRGALNRSPQIKYAMESAPPQTPSSIPGNVARAGR